VSRTGWNDRLQGNPLQISETAANLEEEDKAWLIDDLAQVNQMGFARIDIVDIAALDRDQWMSRLDPSDIIVIGGGDTRYILRLMQKIGFDHQLYSWLETKILIGISAGSVMCGQIINPKGQQGSKFIDFLVVPHKRSVLESHKGYDSLLCGSDWQKSLLA
jgi:dipeptidase E